MVIRTVGHGAAVGVAAHRLRIGLARCAIAGAAVAGAATAQADVGQLGGAPEARTSHLALAGSTGEELARTGLPALQAVTRVADSGLTASTGPGRPAAPGRRDDEPQGYTIVLAGLGLVAFLAHRRWSR